LVSVLDCFHRSLSGVESSDALNLAEMPQQAFFVKTGRFDSAQCPNQAFPEQKLQKRFKSNGT
jgi:hypothetical protein